MQADQKTEEYIVSEDLEQTKKAGWKEKLENFINGPYFVPVCLVLVAIIAFALGRISGLQGKKEPVRVLDSNNSPPNPSLILREGSPEPSVPGEVKGVNTGQAQPAPEASAGAVVASKSGTKYHYPWCAGAKQISAKNLITFDSIEEARAKGYTPASNCKGLK